MSTVIYPEIILAKGREAALLRGHHTRRRSSPGFAEASAALPIIPIISGNWYYESFHFHRKYHNSRVNRKS